jgi:hypothetical protein
MKRFFERKKCHQDVPFEQFDREVLPNHYDGWQRYIQRDILLIERNPLPKVDK